MVTCPDQPGIVAAISQFLFTHGANILHSDQHTTDPSGGTFYLRVEFELPEIQRNLTALRESFAPLAERFQMEARIALHDVLPRVAIFVSKEDHCLQELLWHVRAGDIRCQISMVVSNHPDLENVVKPFGIPFHVIPIPKEDKVTAERMQRDLVRGHADVVVLARYMQIVSPQFIGEWPNQMINIHHSFLPAFVGAKPYHQAYQRGVKLIGATAHFVTSELDAGPIIEQSVQRVDHRSDVEELKRLGRQIERDVLARAVKWYVEDRVLVHGNRTVVFA